MAKRQTDKVKGCRKGGRNKKWCEIYRKSGTREKNKLARMKRTARLQPNNNALLTQLADVLASNPR